MFHPAIPDGKTWSELGEHGEHGEHGKDGKYQRDDLKHYICDSKHSICDSNHSICQPDDSHHSILRYLWRRLKISQHVRLKNMILCQFKIGEHQAKYSALLSA